MAVPEREVPALAAFVSQASSVSSCPGHVLPFEVDAMSHLEGTVMAKAQVLRLTGYAAIVA